MSPKKPASPAKLGMPKAAPSGPIKNAFDFMKQRAPTKVEAPVVAPVATTSAVVSPKKAVGVKTVVGSVGKDAVMFSRPVKGSGLGAGPKHRVEEKDQPWVEK